jgi:ceramide glucosyltransferase
MVLSEFMEIILIVLIISAGIYNLFSLFCVLDFFGPKRQELKDLPHIPVSIMKPIKGIDPEIRENLESFCRQDYPEYEVLLGFTELTDNAITVARDIAALHPDCNVRIITSKKNLGANQKVSNLQGILEAANYPLIAISDSDMRVDPCYLRKIVGEYYSNKNVGLITSLYKISNPASIGAALESLTVALDFIPSVLVARRLEGVTFGLGASMLLSKKALEDIGGLSVIADYLADDYQIGNRLWKKGYKIILSDYVIEDVAGNMTIAEYFIHQIRWARTYRACRPKGFLGYGITHIFPFSLLLLILQGLTTLPLLILSAVITLRLSLSFVLYKKVICSRKWLRWLVLIPVKDLLSFWIWLWSFLGSKVFWRGKYYRILKGGVIKEKSS